LLLPRHPQYGKIRDPNLDKGDFVFKLESKLIKTKPEIGYGYLIISSHPPAAVEIDGKLYREVPPSIEVKLIEGKHTIGFVASKSKRKKTIEIELSKDERKRIHETLK